MLAFPQEELLPAELQEHIVVWAKNPATLPHPIHEDQPGQLNLVDLDVWIWSHKIAPAMHKGLFLKALWDIFLIPGRWEQLVGKTNWTAPGTDHLHDHTSKTWTWLEGSTLITPAW